MKIKLFTTLFAVTLLSSIALSQNYYLGVGTSSDVQGTSCASCHTANNIAAKDPFYDTWKFTKHAQAYDSLKASLKLSCLQCHTTGWDTSVVNNGADEYVKADTTKQGYSIIDSVGFARTKNVQCEDCHGPMANQNGTLDVEYHFGYLPGGSGTNQLDYSAQLCGKCHSGHDPFFEEWSKSKHALSTSGSAAFAANNKACAKCHVAQNFVSFMKNPSTYKDSILVTGNAMQPITCVACHDPHDAKYPAQLRADITYSTVICDKCHYAEMDSVNVSVAPHEQSGLALSGDPNFGYRYAGYNYDNSAHKWAATERCINCHVNMTPNPDKSNNFGHTFEPRIQACEGCHSDYASSVNTSDSTKMFDYRNTQSTTDSLINKLQNMLNHFSSADSATFAFKAANYNLLAVESDGSHGIHNTRLSQELLMSSIQAISGIVAVDNTKSNVPASFELSQNYPNPFNPSTTIRFSLPVSSDVKIIIYNSVGQLIQTLVNRHYSPGSYTVEWNASNLASGIYFYRIEAKNFNLVKKMVLLK